MSFSKFLILSVLRQLAGELDAVLQAELGCELRKRFPQLAASHDRENGLRAAIVENFRRVDRMINSFVRRQPGNSNQSQRQFERLRLELSQRRGVAPVGD